MSLQHHQPTIFLNLEYINVIIEEAGNINVK